VRPDQLDHGVAIHEACEEQHAARATGADRAQIDDLAHDGVPLAHSIVVIALAQMQHAYRGGLPADMGQCSSGEPGSMKTSSRL
jgi:hypothetical protein